VTVHWKEVTIVCFGVAVTEQAKWAWLLLAQLLLLAPP
jgi:hypothetical protein